MADNPGNQGKRYADRPPRIQPELPEKAIPIPQPPDDAAGNVSILQSLFPLMTIIGYVMISFLGQGRSLLFIIPMGLSVGLSSIYTFWSFFKAQRELAEKKKEYDSLLAEMRRDMVDYHNTQRRFYEYNYPEPDITLSVDGISPDNRAGSRLWERRTFDHDFSMIRVGVGSRPSTVIYEAERGQGEEDPQMKDAIKLDEDSRIVFDVPITLPMYQQVIDDKEEGDEPKNQVRHAMGIAGDPEHVYPLIRSVISNFTAFHAPNDANLYIVGVNRAEKQWDWIYDAKDKSEAHALKSPQEKKAPRQPLIPHFALPKSDRDAEFIPVCFEDPQGKHEDREQDHVAKFWKLLSNEIDRRDLRLQDDKDQRDSISLPLQLVVVDMLDVYDTSSPDTFLENSMLRDVEAEAAVSMIMQKGLTLGYAIIFLLPVRQKIPSGCTAIIEVEKIYGDNERVDFRYAEIGLNTTRYVGMADGIMQTERLENFARNLNRWAVRRSYGEGIPDAVTLLAMNRVSSIPELDIPYRWDMTRYATEAVEENGKEIEPAADWLRVPMGIMSNDEIRRLYFKADGDGVHGMVAGATGSGKSELLMTMILGLSIDYHPSIVNFALIDYKGGQAFIPFESLPHKVDIVTNLGGAAVIRMFKAVQAELDRRSAINTFTDSKHIVDYRNQGLHLLDRDTFKQRFNREKEPYAHLFIIVDEFAEMMAGNAEFKDQLNSITRLGRALGVVLILAAQRPTGVTDQMRANIKMKLSLRVETREESSEMLRRPDAAYLPTGIPGRGYLQIGNENLELLQVAWSGGKYKQYRELIETDPNRVNWSEYNNRTVIWPDRLDREYDEPPALFEVLVDYMDRLTKNDPTYEPQLKPWPDPLPTYMALGKSVPEGGRYLEHGDRLFLEKEREKRRLPGHDEDYLSSLPLNPAVTRWEDYDPETANNHYLWQGVDWQEEAMDAIIGLADDAGRANQRLLWAQLRRGHMALTGSSGYGKTTFLRSVVTSLVSLQSPEELHIYALDFGGRQLEILDDLPHVGSIIRPDETEKILRLIRSLDDELERRKEMLSEARTTNVYSYNSNIVARRKRGEDAKFLPSILVLVDNFAEIKENMDEIIGPIMSIVREGLSNGIHWVATGESPNSFGKLYNLFTERITLKLADSADYGTVVGRGVPGMEDAPGRGFVSMDRTPLEVQVAIPIPVTEKDRKQEKDETNVLSEFARKMNLAWERSQGAPELLPQPILELQELVTFDAVLQDLLEPPETPASFFGIDDRTLGVAIAEHTRALPHFVITGQQQTGKTTAMRNMILSLALHYSPDQVAMVLIDRLGYLFNYGGDRSLTELPHVIMSVTEPEHLSQMMFHLNYEYKELEAKEMHQRDLFIFLDNYDDFNELKPKMEALVQLTRTNPERPVLHFVVAGSDNAMRSMTDFLRRITRFGLAMDNKSVQAQPFNVNLRRNMREAELPIGRGFIVKSGKANMLQVGTHGTRDKAQEEALDDLIDRAVRQYENADRADWYPIPVEEVFDPMAKYGPFTERIIEIAAEKEGVSIDVMQMTASNMTKEEIIEYAENNEIFPILDQEIEAGKLVLPDANGSSNGQAKEEDIQPEKTDTPEPGAD